MSPQDDMNRMIKLATSHRHTQLIFALDSVFTEDESKKPLLPLRDVSQLPQFVLKSVQEKQGIAIISTDLVAGLTAADSLQRRTKMAKKPIK
ncbi:hypothetical protein SAMN04488032_110136 [Pacificibacter marinus]|uniref:Uncharacterized protein n=1 Tax=Pacificibacter marinus TaxID=658057 RepID=A0A1Y5SXJ9_9RHOB|nr:hypothetical protein SAMN04488032_110136 [Pacificibacter marinus]SLN51231.1 hypothetical protein PAM7971_02521 [Pacificibacter marinus]